jgi:hypothetical protein
MWGLLGVRIRSGLVLVVLPCIATDCAQVPRREAHAKAPQTLPSSAALEPSNAPPEVTPSEPSNRSGSTIEQSSGDPLKAALNVDAVFAEAESRAPSAGAAGVAEEPIVIGGNSWVSEAGIPDTRGILFGLKPAFRICYQRAQHDSSALRGDFRLSIDITPSGKVGNVSLPVGSHPSMPIFDSAGAGAPRPNPNNPRLNVALIPCMMARVRATRFSAFDRSYWVTFDFRIR